MILRGMSLQGLVDAAATALGGARGLFGPAALGSGFASTAGLQGVRAGLSASLDSVPLTWQGSGGAGYGRSGGAAVSALDAVTGADVGVSPRVVVAAGESREGRSGMNTVVGDARAGVSAIAPATDTPAGKQILVDHLQGQLDRAKQLLVRSEQRNIMLANMIRSAGGGYGGAPMGGGSPLMGGMPMTGGSAAMGGLPGLGALSGIGASLSPRTGGRQDGIADLGLLGSDPRGSAGGRAVAYARSKIGAPYVWGAEGPDAFDCSGLTQQAYAHAGISIPRTTYEQVNAGVRVSREDIGEGDLILCNWSGPRSPEHVMIAISPTMAIEAPTPGQRVRLTNIPLGHIEVRRVS